MVVLSLTAISYRQPYLCIQQKSKKAKSVLNFPIIKNKNHSKIIDEKKEQIKEICKFSYLYAVNTSSKHIKIRIQKL